MDYQNILKNSETNSDNLQSNGKTTAISTIGVQSGSTRIVIAVLVSKDWIELKICDMEPALIDIGRSYSEAIEYQRQHQTVLKKLETKQTPVEKLLSSADEIISKQKTDPIVFSAMAENLALAWKNLNNHLQNRLKTLDQSVAFYRRCSSFSDLMDKAESEFSVVELPETVEGVRKVLEDIGELKRNLLEYSMFAMNEQQSLLNILNEMIEQNLYDSRPLYQFNEIQNVISFIIDYLERLQERRRRLQTIFLQRKSSLDSQYLRLRFIKQLNEMGVRMEEERSILEGINPGSSAREAGIARYKMDEIERSLKNLGLEAIKLAREIDAHSSEMSSQVKDLAYGTLEEYSSLMFTLEEMKTLQSSFIAFLENSSLVSAKLDAMADSLEQHLPSSNVLPNSTRPHPSSSHHSSTNLTVELIQETIEEIVNQGYHLLDLVETNQSYIQPINAKLHEIQEKSRDLAEKLSLIKPIVTAESATETEAEMICQQQHQQQQQQQQHQHQVIVNEKLNKVNRMISDLDSWLTNNVSDFLRGHQDLGSSLLIVRDFLDKHRKLSIVMENKSMELKVLLSLINQITNETENENVSEELSNSFDQLRINWESYADLLEKRILLCQRYSTFHKTYSDVTRNLDQFEGDLIKLDKVTDSSIRSFNENLVTLKQEIVQLNNLGNNFMKEIKQNKDPFLDKERGVLCSASCLNHVADLMSKIENLLETRRNQMTENRIKESHSVQVSCQTDEIQSEQDTREIKQTIEIDQTRTTDTTKQMTSSAFLDQKATKFGNQQVINKVWLEIKDQHEPIPDRPPVFIQNLVDVTLDEKSVLFLSCAVSGHPMPRVTWYRDGKEVYCSRGQEVTEDVESKTYSLIIQEANRSHQGVYTVQALNSLGEASSSCHVTVNSKNITKHPQFIKYLEDVVVKSGADVTLTCQITGQPEPKITWYFNHRRIDPNEINRFTLTKEGQLYGLIIPSISAEFQGNYCIVAENIAGKAVSSGNVIITDLHKSTSSQSLLALASSSSNMATGQGHLGLPNLPWLSARASSEIRTISTTFREMTKTSKTTTTLATEGPRPFGNSDQQSNDSIVATTSVDLSRPIVKKESITREEHHYRKVNDNEPEVQHIFQQEKKLITDKGEESREVTSLTEGSNNFKSIDPLVMSTGDPKIVRHLVNQLIVPGEEVNFEVEISGNPPPNVVWSRKGILLKENDDLVITSDPLNGIYRLTFKEAWPEDSGLITVKAVNCHGSAESNANLLIQESRRESIKSESAIRQIQEGASVRQKKDFFTRLAMEQTASSTSYDYKRCMSLDRKLMTEGPGRLFKSSGAMMTNLASGFQSDLRPSDSFESLPCGYKYSTSSAKSDISETEQSYFSAQEDNVTINSEFKPVWSPKSLSSPFGSNRTQKWRPVRAPGQKSLMDPTSSFTKAMSIPRGDVCPSLLSTTLSVGSLSQTSLHSSISTSQLGQDISDHPTSEGNPVRAPIFITGLKDKSIPEASYISLECEVDGYPPPTIRWYHNDIEVASAPGSHVDSLTGGICRLIIEKATLSASGKYVCRASNSAGSISTSCYLKVVNQSNNSTNNSNNTNFIGKLN